MGFWESFQAGFFGAAGVDYYAMQTRDELRRLRADNLYAVAMLRGQLEDAADVDDDLGRSTKRCPDCAEDVWAEARICRFCRFKFASAVVSEAAEEAREAETEPQREALREPASMGRWRLQNVVMGFSANDAVEIILGERGQLALQSELFLLTLGSGAFSVEIASGGSALIISDPLRQIIVAPLERQPVDFIADFLGKITGDADADE